MTWLRGRTGGEVSASRATLSAQIAQSAAGFTCTAIVLASSTPQQFGAFVLAQGCALLILGIVDSAMLVPLLVRGSQPESADGLSAVRRFDATVAMASLAAAALVGVVFHLLLPWMAPDLPNAGHLALAATLWGLGLVARDWLRQRQLLLRRFGSLIRSDVAAGLFSVGAVWVVAAHAGPAHDDPSSLVAANAVVGVLAVWLLAMAPGLKLAPGAPAWRALFRAGGWSFAASQITWVQSQTYVFLVSSFLGTAAAGTVAAARLVFMPIQVVVAGLSRGWLAQLAAHHGADSGAAARRFVKLVLPRLGVAVLGWTVVAIAGMTFFRPELAGKGYDFGHALVLAWGLAMLCSCARTVVTQVHRARGRFRFLAFQGAVGAALSVSAVSLGAVQAGMAGAITGLALAEATVLSWAMWALRPRGNMP